MCCSHCCKVQKNTRLLSRAFVARVVCTRRGGGSTHCSGWLADWSIQLHSHSECVRGCMHACVCVHVFDKLIILSVICNYSKIIVFVLLSLYKQVSCVLFWLIEHESESECVNDKSFRFQLMHCAYTLYLLTAHLDCPNYTVHLGGKQACWSASQKTAVCSSGLWGFLLKKTRSIVADASVAHL